MNAGGLHAAGKKTAHFHCTARFMNHHHCRCSLGKTIVVADRMPFHGDSVIHLSPGWQGAGKGDKPGIAAIGRLLHADRKTTSFPPESLQAFPRISG